MSETKIEKSLELWKKYGQHVLVPFPYNDAVIASTEGSKFKDMDGNEYLDFAAGQFCSTLGHNHPKLIERLTAQMRRNLHTATDFLPVSVLEASAKFAEVAPGELNKAMFLSTGTEANECAVRIAKTFTKKTGVAGFTRGYYGISLATQNLTGMRVSRTRYDTSPSSPESYKILTPNCGRCPVKASPSSCKFACLDVSLEIIGKDVDKIAAFIAEPIVSAGGMIVPPPGYFAKMKEIAEECGALFIADEAQSGFGRTGKWFGIEHHGVVPDILCVAKSSGGGFPVSGVITTDKIAERALRNGFKHLSSHQSDPVPAEAVSAVIDIVREEGLVRRSEVLGKYLKDKLIELKGKWDVISDVRGIGLMVGMLLDTDKIENIEPILNRECKKRGLHLNSTSHFETVFRILPPLTVTEAEIDVAVNAIDDSLRAIHEGRGATEAELIPKNPYSKAYAERSLGRRTVGKLLSKIWESSPESLVKAVSKKIRS
ncbi:MAG: aspartate aminotransferase family protein [Deltaproteobacteria bacterium]